MAAVLAKFLRILKIELDDLARDIETLVALYERKRCEREITNYVYLENVSLIRHEVSCLKELQREIDLIDPGLYPDLPALTREVERVVRETGQGCGLPDSLGDILERRIEKATRYVLEP